MKRSDDLLVNGGAPPPPPIPALPRRAPIQLVDRTGRRVAEPPGAAARPEGPDKEADEPAFPVPGPEVLRELHRRMVIGRRFDRQASALTRQGRLAVYPSSYGQEGCQVGGVLAMAPADWLFPTYRDSVSLLTRGVDPVRVLTLLRGDWHSGYDPGAHRCAPQCTPLATNAPHAVGLTYAARRKGEDVAAVVMMGDGATSEGDAHEAYNFAAVWNAPVVFLVQNNQWAISVPVAKQSKAPTLAHKAIGYGMRGYHVDGNDAAAVHSVVSHALAEARAGGGPAMIEARTYRLDPHTNADAPQRYRDESEVAYWTQRDPISRIEALLRAEGNLAEADLERVNAEAEEVAAAVREQREGTPDPQELFTHVYAATPPHLAEQAALLREELRGVQP